MKVMSKSNVKKLHTSFPWLKKRGSLGVPPFFDVQDGWCQLIWDLCEKIDAELMADTELAARFTVDQIKQKFGTLRYYWSGGSEAIRTAVADAEAKSSRTCEVCGKHGTLRTDSMFIQTLCDTDHDDYVETPLLKKARRRALRAVLRAKPRVQFLHKHEGTRH